MTSKDIAERNQGKMSYSLKVLKSVEKAFREIYMKQKHANALIPVTKLYREKVIEVVDDFVYFNQALLDVKDFQGQIMKPQSSLETETERSKENSDIHTSLTDSDSDS